MSEPTIKVTTWLHVTEWGQSVNRIMFPRDLFARAWVLVQSNTDVKIPVAVDGSITLSRNSDGYIFIEFPVMDSQRNEEQRARAQFEALKKRFEGEAI